MASKRFFSGELSNKSVCVEKSPAVSHTEEPGRRGGRGEAALPPTRRLMSIKAPLLTAGLEPSRVKSCSTHCFCQGISGATLQRSSTEVGVIVVLWRHPVAMGGGIVYIDTTHHQSGYESTS